jgi:hypothetical protein
MPGARARLSLLYCELRAADAYVMHLLDQYDWSCWSDQKYKEVENTCQSKKRGIERDGECPVPASSASSAREAAARHGAGTAHSRQRKSKTRRNRIGLR